MNHVGWLPDSLVVILQAYQDKGLRSDDLCLCRANLTPIFPVTPRNGIVPEMFCSDVRNQEIV